MKQVPLILQSAINECGLACLAMIVGHFQKGTAGDSADLAAIRRQFAGFEQGLTAKQLMAHAHQYGLGSRGLRCEPVDLYKIKCPAILHWRMDHFIVLIKTSRRGCLVHDPARGRVTLSWQELDQQFTGVVLEFWPSHEPKLGASGNARLRLSHFLPLLSGMNRQLIWLVLLSIVLQFIVLVGPWHVQWTVDEALVSGDHHLLGVLALAFSIVLMLRLVAQALRGFLIIQLGHALSFRMASGLLHHLLRLPSRWFDAHHTGDVVSRFGSLGPIRDLLTQGLAAALVDIIMLFMSLGFMLVYSPILAAIVCGVHAAFLVLPFVMVPRLRRFTLGNVVAQAEEQSHLLASIRAIQGIKIYGQEDDRHRQWQTLHARTLSESMSLQRTQLGMGLLASLVGGLELVVIVYLAANSVLTGVLSVGMFFAFISYRGHFADRLRALVEQAIGFRTLQTHLERLAEIWFEPVEEVHGHESVQNSTMWSVKEPKSLALLDVGVYQPGTQSWLFRHLQLSVEAGEYVAIVGPSGSGKTTLIKLLLGLTACDEGEVIYDGVALSGSTRAALRRQCACVLQSDEFLGGTLLENLTLSAPVDIERVYACLLLVDMAEIVRGKPMGLQTLLGGHNAGFSSGQLQRLMLARALYREPQLLLLDEGTANLDVQSAQRIAQVVEKLTCTRIVVTHDLAFAAGADRVYLLEAGALKPVELTPKSAIAVSAGELGPQPRSR